MVDRRPSTERRPSVAPLSFNVAGLLADPPGSNRDYPLTAVTLVLDGDLRLAAPLDGTVRLSRTNRGLIVSGSLSASLATECSRCLTPIEVPLALRIDEEALPSTDLATGERIGDDEGIDLLRVTDHHELDLEPSVREAVSLAEPIAPLCRSDCPGLCATCGERLEGPPHGHADDEFDPRLAVLRSLMVDAEAETE